MTRAQGELLDTATATADAAAARAGAPSSNGGSGNGHRPPEPERRAPAPRRFPFGRLPVVRQQSARDCGAACLATVCRYYGKRVSLNQVRELAAVGRSGASMLNLLHAAETLGYDATPMQATYEQLSAQERPAVANWKGLHWIVVYRATPTHVVVADPARGLVTLSKEEFLEGWTRYTIYLDPTERLEKVEESRPRLEQFRGYVRPYHRLLFEVALASLSIQIFNMFLPLFTKFIIDDVISKQDTQWLPYSIAGIAAMTLLGLWASYCRQRLLVHVSIKVVCHMVSDYYRHVLSLPLPFFESRKVGDVTSRFEENQKITSFLTKKGLDSLLDVVTAVCYLGLMLYFNVLLTAIACFLLALHVVSVYVITPHLQNAYRDVFQKGADSDSLLIESIRGLRTIKTMSIEHLTRWAWEDLYVGYSNAYFKAIRFGLISSLASGLINNLVNVAVLFAGALLVLRNQLTVGELFAFTILTRGISGPALSLVGAWGSLQEALSAVERLNDVFETKPELTPEAGKERIVLPALRGHVQLDDLTFRYEASSKRNVLQNVTIDVEPGQRIAFVGRSGSGKSTLIKLLAGFYAPSSGSIYVDGFNMEDVWLPSLRQQIGIVPQQSYLFKGTIRENIAKAKPEASLSDIMEAARLAGAHDFITQFPKGYNTMIAEQGSNLSGGQRQRIAIARALVQAPRMLILDEATSALDNESERIVQRNIDEAFRDCTIFMIAHRLSTVRHADLIVVLDHGNVVEQGTHSQLMARKGLYYLLSTQQLNL